LDFEPPSKKENFLFINALNEWAEGNHLEPDKKWGTQYLQVTKEVMEQYV
jgi:ribosome biogenesis protein Tsr3